MGSKRTERKVTKQAAGPAVHLGLTPYGSGWPVFTIKSEWAAASLPDDVDAQPEDLDSDVIFTSEAARLLKATKSRTTFLARTGVIPAFKVGKKEWRCSRAALQEWIRSQTKGSPELPEPTPVTPRAKRPVKSTVTKKRKDMPSDLSPKALMKAIKDMRFAGE